ncbi:MAG TPA: FHA domain-containing protein [Sandaracinaceae bacterium]
MSEDAAPDQFLDRAASLLDWTALAPWIAAVETRLGMPVSIALFKMTLLERWFQLSGAELDDACHGRVAFRRFLGAPLHGPVAEVWMYRQFKPRLAAADREVGKLITAVELHLSDRGLAPPAFAWTATRSPAVTSPQEGTRTTVLEPGQLSAMAADAESAARFSRTAVYSVDLMPPRTAPAAPARAVLVWPWGASTPIDRVLRIGRDPEFSPFARPLWADPGISRRHAELVPREDGIEVRDLGSTNGTVVGDVPLARRGSVLVRADTLLRFGANLAVKLVFLPHAAEMPA